VTLPIGAVQGLVNAVGGAGLSSSAASGISASGSQALSLAEPAGSASASLAAGPAEGVGAAGSPTGVGAAGAPSGVGAAEAGSGADGQEAGGGFGEALTSAISSLEGSQQSASAAAQALATGSTGNPEAAVVTVADAQLAMQLASQLRTKGTEALQQIFQTQV
jgi:flagellar hook-basal body complex protein FliE